MNERKVHNENFSIPYELTSFSLRTHLVSCKIRTKGSDPFVHDYVLEWAKLCKSPKDIYNSIVLPLKKKGYGLEITTNPPFLKELIPHLTNFETSMNVESISRALRK